MAVTIDLAVAVIRGTDPTRFADPSPCPDFTVGHLVGHLAFGFLLAERAGRRQGWEPDWDLTGVAPFLADAPPAGWAERAAEQGRATTEAWSTPAAWEGPTTWAGMQNPAATVGSLMIFEFTVHAWDLAVSTGQSLQPPAELAAAVLEGAAAIAHSGRAMGWFGDEVPIGPDASALDRALAAAGRDPAWRP